MCVGGVWVDPAEAEIEIDVDGTNCSGFYQAVSLRRVSCLKLGSQTSRTNIFC